MPLIIFHVVICRQMFQHIVDVSIFVWNHRYRHTCSPADIISCEYKPRLRPVLSSVHQDISFLVIQADCLLQEHRINILKGTQKKIRWMRKELLTTEASDNNFFIQKFLISIQICSWLPLSWRSFKYKDWN